MGDLAAIVGVVFLLVGVALVALRGNSGGAPWSAYLGIGLAIIGLGVEVLGAIFVA